MRAVLLRVVDGRAAKAFNRWVESFDEGCRLATVGACQWLIGAVPPALLADMGGGLLRRLRGATGARMVIEFLLFSALPWWALRQALHDNDADQIGWTLAHACHQLRAADLPIHAQACALHLGIHRGAHREVQRVLRAGCRGEGQTMTGATSPCAYGNFLPDRR